MEAVLQRKANARSPSSPIRASVLAPCQRGDQWIAPCRPGFLVLYLNNQPVSLLPGTSLDHASLNELLFSIQHRLPRSH